MSEKIILDELINLSHELGKEERQLVILGEGNTSANCGDGTFWVKASGSQLSDITEAGFSRVYIEKVVNLLESDRLSDEQISMALSDVLVDKSQKRPSVETFIHALCYNETDSNWVGHTHTTSVNQILCSKAGAEPFKQHLFPDAIVVCGINPAIVPYIDPGFHLAVAVRTELRKYQDRYGKTPKVLLMENHGIIALGKSSKEVFNIHLMADKWAKVILGTYILGGPKYMSEDNENRIENRIDEHYRRKQLGQ